MTPEQIQLFINAAGSPAAIALGSSPAIIKVFGCIHEYIGLWWGPHQILREAKAQAHADATAQLIKQSLDANATEDERLLARGLMAKDKTTIREQRNNQSIVLKALPEVKEDARPEEVEDDWYANFFDKSRLVSDEEMQMLWGKVLAGEINEPGTFSRRTLSLLSDLDKKSAQSFLLLCRFSLTKNSLLFHPMIYKNQGGIFDVFGIDMAILLNLESIGLISYSDFDAQLVGNKNEKMWQFGYFSTTLTISCLQNLDEKLKTQIGHVMFTDLGKQLALLCSPQPYPGFEDYLVAKWKEFGYRVIIQREGQAPREA